jgi:hypothetical protein
MDESAAWCGNAMKFVCLPVNMFMTHLCISEANTQLTNVLLAPAAVLPVMHAADMLGGEVGGVLRGPFGTDAQRPGLLSQQGIFNSGVDEAEGMDPSIREFWAIVGRAKPDLPALFQRGAADAGERRISKY